MTSAAERLRSSRSLPLAVLALLAYLPSFTAAPGRMPADTKVFLYLDPGGLVSDAAFSWDTSQFGGWFPHQTITYLWPSGPWYWFFETIGAPDWIAHRLWIGTILILGGAARVFGPVLGSIIFWAIIQGTDVFLRSAIDVGVPVISLMTGSQAAVVRLILVGLGIMLLMIFRPQGILGDRKELALDAR